MTDTGLRSVLVVAAAGVLVVSAIAPARAQRSAAREPGQAAERRDPTPSADMLLDLDLLQESEPVRQRDLWKRMRLLERLRVLETMELLESGPVPADRRGKR